MRKRFLAALALVPITALAQQTPKPTSASASKPADRSSAAAKPASQILDENRSSIGEIVAAGNTSLRLGTGFFVGSSGLFLTNFHVVEGTDLVGVKVPGSSDVLWAKKATGFDVENDLVVLEVETGGKKPVSFGDSDQAQVGEQIVVIGNPEGLEQTVSNGLLSGIRDVDGRKLFQISAPISEGSSGSPVFNAHGDVIGVVVSTLESGQNLNFAVPINFAKPLLSGTEEEEISELPKRKRSEIQGGTSAVPTSPAADPAKLAVQAISEIADKIRACEGSSMFTPAKEKKLNFYYRTHADAPTDVRFDVNATDSLVAPFEGIVEFSVHLGVSPCLRADDIKSCAPDRAPFSKTTRYRYFYRIDGSIVQLDRRTYFDEQQQTWVLRQGKSDQCWDRIANRDSN
ncbi:MAG TPA: S1C family serine protease [Terriglobales bacterium]|nr:S1C family serine protease [Terriglobales bacterium]